MKYQKFEKGKTTRKEKRVDISYHFISGPNNRDMACGGIKDNANNWWILLYK